MQILIESENKSQGITPDERTMLRQLFDTNKVDSEVKVQFSDLFLQKGLTK